MSGTRLVLIGVWIASIAAWFVPGESVALAVLRWTGPLMIVTHVVEFAVFREVFAKAGGSTLSHFWNTLVFGVFYIKPLRELRETPPAP